MIESMDEHQRRVWQRMIDTANRRNDPTPSTWLNPELLVAPSV
jgi:hypothetical protein